MRCKDTHLFLLCFFSRRSRYCVVSYAAVLSVVTQRFSPEEEALRDDTKSGCVRDQLLRDGHLNISVSCMSDNFPAPERGLY